MSLRDGPGRGGASERTRGARVPAFAWWLVFLVLAAFVAAVGVLVRAEA